MRHLFRFIVFVLLVGGWSLAAASLYVVRTTGQKVVVIPKDHISFKDTYVDTRAWTLDNVRQHPAVVKRMIAEGKADLLANTVDPSRGDVQAQLTEAIEQPAATSPAAQNAAKKIKAGVHAATQEAKSIFNF
jgi:hypothetical protein